MYNCNVIIIKEPFISLSKKIQFFNIISFVQLVIGKNCLKANH